MHPVIVAGIFVFGLAVALLGLYGAAREIIGGEPEGTGDRGSHSFTFMGFKIELELRQSGALILLGTVIAVGVWLIPDPDADPPATSVASTVADEAPTSCLLRKVDGEVLPTTDSCDIELRAAGGAAVNDLLIADDLPTGDRSDSDNGISYCRVDSQNEVWLKYEDNDREDLGSQNTRGWIVIPAGGEQDFGLGDVALHDDLKGPATAVIPGLQANDDIVRMHIEGPLAPGVIATCSENVLEHQLGGQVEVCWDSC